MTAPCPHLGPFDAGLMACVVLPAHTGGSHVYQAAWAADPKHGDEAEQ